VGKEIIDALSWNFQHQMTAVMPYILEVEVILNLVSSFSSNFHRMLQLSGSTLILVMRQSSKRISPVHAQICCISLIPSTCRRCKLLANVGGSIHYFCLFCHWCNRSLV